MILQVHVLSNATSNIVFYTSVFLSYSFAPLIADVRFGRYDVIKFGSILYGYSILCYLAIFTKDISTLKYTVLSLWFNQ